MAKKHDIQQYTTFHFVENGVDIKRQVHSMTVQDCLGVVHLLTGSELPRWIRINTGMTMMGANFAEALLAPEGIVSPTQGEFETKLLRYWRDAFFLTMGFFAIMFLRSFAELFGMV